MQSLDQGLGREAGRRSRRGPGPAARKALAVAAFAALAVGAASQPTARGALSTSVAEMRRALASGPGVMERHEQPDRRGGGAFEVPACAAVRDAMPCAR